MKIVSVQDISCYGQCSLTVALPILSYYGVETAILPSAILSTHTSGFTNFTVHDLTDEMPKIVNHWIDEKIKFDGIYTGYIGDPRQFDIILDAKKNLLNKNGLFIVDPAMADHGSIYWGLGEDIINGMKKISSVADYILPNITEASFLTGNKYEEVQTDEYINKLLKDLKALGTKNVILTGVEKDGKIGAAFYDGKNTEIVLYPKEAKSYHGTGDIFSSVIIGELYGGATPKAAIDAACRFVIDSIKLTNNDKSHSYGVKFEEILREKKY